MNFYLIGSDYKTAQLRVREDLYRKRKAIVDFWKSWNSVEVEILSTCNRFEVYLAAEEALEQIELFKKEFPVFSGQSYTKLGRDAVFGHALRVACGLESQIKGEIQILEQIKHWRENFQSFILKEFWAEVINLAEVIRIKSGLDTQLDSIASPIMEELKKQRKGTSVFNVVVVGTGKIAELFADLKDPEIHFYFAAHKNYRKAEELAKRSRGEPVLLKNLPQILSKAHALISATSSPHFVLGKKDFLAVQESLYLYDLALPRDINPDVAQVKGVVLRNLDDLTSLFEGHNNKIRERLDLAECLVEEIVEGEPDEDSVAAGNAAQPFGLKTG